MLGPRIVRAKPMYRLTLAVVSVVVGDAHTCAIEASGQFRCWGDNLSGKPMSL